MNKIVLLALSSVVFTACATTKPPAATQLSAKQFDQVAQAVASKQQTATPADAGTFDCTQLYKNYDTAMAGLQPETKKKKSFLGSVLGTGLATTGAGLLGANIGVLKTMNKVEQAAAIVNKAGDAQDNLNTLTSASKTISVNKSAYNLAMEKGCSVEELETITKKYSS